MELKKLSCRACGIGHLYRGNDSLLHCRNCGAEFREEHELDKIREEMEQIVDAQKQERVQALRHQLYEKVNAKYINSTEIREICHEIRNYLPHDFRARFYEVANGQDENAYAEFLRMIDIEANYDAIGEIVAFTVRSLSPILILPVKNLVENAYKKPNLDLYKKLITDIEQEAARVEEGIYEVTLPRDVFVLYSSKDMPRVMELVEKLENSGFSCFVAMRNLQHGRNAVENYKRALEIAIRNCTTVVFVSSMNSRNYSCDALRVEIPYIRDCDRADAPRELRNHYASIPACYKKPRVEYRIEESRHDNNTTPDRAVSEFFSGLEYCTYIEQVVERVAQYITEIPEEQVDEPVAAVNEPVTEEHAVKFCVACETENRPEARFCWSCGKTDFADTLAECEKRRASATKPTGKANATEDKPISPAPSVPSASANKPRRQKEKTNGDFEISEDGVLTKYHGNAKHVVVPEGVKKIDEKAFDGNKTLESVVLPNSLACIGRSVFSDCQKLTSITFPKQMDYIDEFAFSGCHSLKRVELPQGIPAVDDALFWDCKNLTDVSIPKSVERIKGFAFDGCGKLSNIYIENLKAWCEIEYWKTDYCDPFSDEESSISFPFRYADNLYLNGELVTDLIIPDDVTEIGDYAFYGCSSITSVTIPRTVESIGKKAFEDCGNLKRIVFQGTRAEWDEINAIGNRYSEVEVICLTLEAEENRYADMKDFEISEDGVLTKYVGEGGDVVIPNSVMRIGICAFEACKNLTSITIPNSVTNIGAFAFSNCSNLTSITIPNSVTNIGASAFSNCSNLTSITIPNSVTNIGAFAFSNCENLTSITIPNTVTSIGNNPFTGCSNLERIEVDPKNKIYHSVQNCLIATESKALIAGCKIESKTLIAGCKNSVIPNSVTSIGNSAFEACENLTSIAIPSSVASIGMHAFADCKHLTIINFSGTTKDWRKIIKGDKWNAFVPAPVVHCSNGYASL